TALQGKIDQHRGPRLSARAGPLGATGSCTLVPLRPSRRRALRSDGLRQRFAVAPFVCVRLRLRDGRYGGLPEDPGDPWAWFARLLARGRPPLAQIVAPQDLIPRHAQNRLAPLGREHNTVCPAPLRLGLALGRSILEPFPTKCAPGNTQSHVTTSQKLKGVAPSMHDEPTSARSSLHARRSRTLNPPGRHPVALAQASISHQGVEACDGERAVPA